MNKVPSYLTDVKLSEGELIDYDMRRLRCTSRYEPFLPRWATSKNEASRSVCGGSGSAHLHPGADGRERVHLGEADRLAVHGRGLLHHDGGAGLALGPRGRRGVGRLGLGRSHNTQHTTLSTRFFTQVAFSSAKSINQSINKASLYYRLYNINNKNPKL